LLLPVLLVVIPEGNLVSPLLLLLLLPVSLPVLLVVIPEGNLQLRSPSFQPSSPRNYQALQER
jgi:hypothetical protein